MDKRFVLFGLILLLSMTVVLATSTSNIKFYGDFLSDYITMKPRSGYYVWGALNRLQPVTVTVTNKVLNNVSIPGGIYWVSGYIKFNRIAVGEQTSVSIFNTIISASDPNDPLGDYIIQYLNGNPINPDFYVRRIDQNTYEIVCNNVPISTRAVVHAKQWFEQNIIWSFTATIQV
jgi:hypothetical protein